MESVSSGDLLYKVLTILLFSTFCCFSTPGFSQDESDLASDKMDLAVKSATASFEAGQYREAARQFAEAFGHLKNYNLKKNEMVSWFKAGECAAAIDAGRLYLSGNKDITKFDRGDVKTVTVRCLLIAAKKFLNLGRLEKCEVQLNEAESLIAADAYAPISGSNESEEIQEMRDQISSIKTRENPVIEPESGSILGPVLTISGGTMVVVGGVLLGLAEFEDAKSTANLLNTMGWIGLVGGVVMSGTGLYLWLGEDAATKETTRILVDPGSKRIQLEFFF